MDHQQLQTPFKTFLGRNQCQKKTVLNSYPRVLESEFEQLVTGFKDWVSITTKFEELSTPIFMKEKTWLNTVSMSFYSYGLTLKGVCWCFFKIVHQQSFPDWKKEKDCKYLSYIMRETFDTNDKQKRVWKEKEKSLLRLKRKGKGIMASGFLTLVGRLQVSDFVPDHQLLQDPGWPLDENWKPR